MSPPASAPTPLSPSPADRVAIIGAGYAGLSAAVELSRLGITVSVFEASRSLGGRARSVTRHGLTLDNGQHILIGAYSDTLALMRLVGADPEQLLLRLPLQLEFPGGLRLRAPQLPSPLHLAWALIAARGLSLSEKWAALRFMRHLEACHFQLPHDLPLTELLRQHQQPARVCHYLWHSLCIAALNTPVEEASSQVFANVLRDTLAASRQASDLLLPRRDFGQLFPEPAAAFIRQHGGEVRLATAVQHLETAEAQPGYWLTTHTAQEQRRHGPYRHVICATAPQHVGALLAPLIDQAASSQSGTRLTAHTQLTQLTQLGQQLQGLRYQPIASCYLAYPAHVRLPAPMLGMSATHSQWLFDRGQTHGTPGLLAAVISAQGAHMRLDHAQLAQAIHEEIAAVVPHLPAPLWSQVIVEKRATWACTPGLSRPDTHTGLPGLLLAGDYVAGDYPATLEAAVQSGLKAARAIAHHSGTANAS